MEPLIKEYDKLSIVTLEELYLKKWNRKQNLETELEIRLQDPDVFAAINNIDVAEKRAIIAYGGTATISPQNLARVNKESNDQRDLAISETGKSLEKNLYTNLRQIRLEMEAISERIEYKKLKLSRDSRLFVVCVSVGIFAYMAWKYYWSYQEFQRQNIRTTLKQLELRSRFDPWLTDKVRDFSENRSKYYSENDPRIFEEFSRYCTKRSKSWKERWPDKYIRTDKICTGGWTTEKVCKDVEIYEPQAYKIPLKMLDDEVLMIVKSIQAAKVFLHDKEETSATKQLNYLVAWAYAGFSSTTTTAQQKQKEKIDELVNFMGSELYVDIFKGESIKLSNLLRRKHPTKPDPIYNDPIKGEDLFREHVSLLSQAHDLAMQEILTEQQIISLYTDRESGYTGLFKWFTQSTGLKSVGLEDTVDVKHIMEMVYSGSYIYVQQWVSIFKMYVNIALVAYNIVMNGIYPLIQGCMAIIQGWKVKSGDTAYGARIAGIAIASIGMNLGSIGVELTQTAKFIFETRVSVLSIGLDFVLWLTPLWYFKGPLALMVAGYKKLTGNDHPIEKEKQERAKKREATKAKKFGKVETRILCSVCKTDLATLKEQECPKNVYCSQGCGFLAAQIKT